MRDLRSRGGCDPTRSTPRITVASFQLLVSAPRQIAVCACFTIAARSASGQQGVIRAELVRRLEWNRESVDRLFRLDHASRLEQIEAAFQAVGVAVQVSFVGEGKGNQPHA